MDIKICIVYKEGDQKCINFLKVYNKYIAPKVKKYRVAAHVVSNMNLRQSQMVIFGPYLKRGIFPFAFVGRGKQNEIYGNMDQVTDIIIAMIKANKSTYDRGTYVSQIGIKPTEDFLDLERQKDLYVESTDATDDSYVTFGEKRTSNIIAAAVPVKQKNTAMMGVYHSGAAEDFQKKGGFDPIEKSFVKDQIDAEQHDIDMFVYETFKDTAYDPDYSGSESKVSAEGIGDRLPSRLNDIMNGRF